MSSETEKSQTVWIPKWPMWSDPIAMTNQWIARYNLNISLIQPFISMSLLYKLYTGSDWHWPLQKASPNNTLNHNILQSHNSGLNLFKSAHSETGLVQRCREEIVWRDEINRKRARMKKAKKLSSIMVTTPRNTFVPSYRRWNSPHNTSSRILSNSIRHGTQQGRISPSIRPLSMFRLSTAPLEPLLDPWHNAIPEPFLSERKSASKKVN